MSSWEGYDDEDGAQRRRDEAEYQRGIAETEAAQSLGPPGSPAREAAYADIDRRLYEEGY